MLFEVAGAPSADQVRVMLLPLAAGDDGDLPAAPPPAITPAAADTAPTLPPRSGHSRSSSLDNYLKESFVTPGNSQHSSASSNVHVILECSLLGTPALGH